MKNLANCKPSEFLRQTNLIRKSVSNWLDVTQVLNIRKNKAKLHDGMTEEQKQKATEEQISSNINLMLDSILEEHPDETLELLALVCFVDPKDVDDHPVGEYLESIGELLNDKSVMSFFSSLVRLGQMHTSDVPNQ